MCVASEQHCKINVAQVFRTQTSRHGHECTSLVVCVGATQAASEDPAMQPGRQAVRTAGEFLQQGAAC